MIRRGRIRSLSELQISFQVSASWRRRSDGAPGASGQVGDATSAGVRRLAWLDFVVPLASSCLTAAGAGAGVSCPFISCSLVRRRWPRSDLDDLSSEKCPDDIRASPRGSSEKELRFGTSAAPHANDRIRFPSMNIKLRLVGAPSLQERHQSGLHHRELKQQRAN